MRERESDKKNKRGKKRKAKGNKKDNVILVILRIPMKPFRVLV